jgi:hypothetical protein
MCSVANTEGHFTHEIESLWPLHFEHSHWWKRRSQHSKWMQDGCKVYMDSYMTLNGSCFMVISIISKYHLLEVGLTRDHETMALQTLITVDLVYFFNVWGPCMDRNSLKKHLVEGPIHISSYYTQRPVTTLHDFGSGLKTTFGHFFWALTISWSHLLVRVWSGLSVNLTLIVIPCQKELKKFRHYGFYDVVIFVGY